MKRAPDLWKAVKREVNIWRLRRWAKKRGYIRNKTSYIERWDDPLISEWRLKIKREGSVRPGLLASSRMPRADARTGPGQYINPLRIVEQVGREVFLTTIGQHRDDRAFIHPLGHLGGRIDRGTGADPYEQPLLLA